MGKVVLDGSDSTLIIDYGASTTNTLNAKGFSTLAKIHSQCVVADTMITYPTGDYLYAKDVEGIVYGTDYVGYGDNCYMINVNKSKLSTQNIDGFKKYLQANPTTVVYELATPYYEPIEPQVSQYSLPSVKDGDMEIITALPIEIDLTYRTDINGTTTLEEELANAQSSTDLTDIINSEVDE